MGEIDEAVRDSVRVALHERAEGAVQVEELLAGARRRGVWRRTFRHNLLGCGAAAAVTAVVLSAAFVIAPPSATQVAERGGGGGWALPRPPAAGPGDGNVLRLDTADPDVTRLEWFTEGFDRQAVHVGRVRSLQGFQAYLVMLGRSEKDLESMYRPDRFGDGGGVAGDRVMIGARPGTLWLAEKWAHVRWKRVDGTWLGVFMEFEKPAEREPGADRAAVIQVAQWVRSSVAYRCVVDFRLDWTPPGSHPIGCQLSIMAGYRRYGQLFAADNGITFMAYTEPQTHTGPVEVNTTAGNRAVELTQDATRYPYGDRVLSVGASHFLPSEDSFRIVVGFTPLDDPIPNR